MPICKKKYGAVHAIGDSAMLAELVKCDQPVEGSRDGYCSDHSGGSIYGGHRNNAPDLDQVNVNLRDRLFWQLHQDRNRDGLSVGREGKTGQRKQPAPDYMRLIANVDALVEQGLIGAKVRDLILQDG